MSNSKEIGSCRSVVHKKHICDLCGRPTPNADFSQELSAKYKNLEFQEWCHAYPITQYIIDF